MSGIFGPIVTKTDVTDAVEDAVHTWLPTYLAEMERRTGREPASLPMIRSFVKTNRFDRRPEDQLPACVIVSAGTTGKPEKTGDGRISAWWRIGIAIVVAASTREATDELAGLYGAALRTLLLQHPSLGGVAEGLDLVVEAYDEVPTDYLQIGSIVEVDVDVKFSEIANRLEGPVVPENPPTDVPADWPTAATVDIDITRRSLS